MVDLTETSVWDGSVAGVTGAPRGSQALVEFRRRIHTFCSAAKLKYASVPDRTAPGRTLGFSGIGRRSLSAGPTPRSNETDSTSTVDNSRCAIWARPSMPTPADNAL